MIKMLVMDVDGTLTDGKIYMGANGECLKVFNIKDGLGIREILIPAGIIPVIITGRSSAILERRCQELGITELYQGVTNKTETMLDVLNKKKISFKDVAYIGDDLNDMDCMKLIKESHGVVGCPNDAVKQIKEIADYICSLSGGEGAVREFIEYLIN